MPRCGCSDSCSCLIVAGEGVTVEGIGTIERPYEISSESAELIERLEFLDTPTVDFTTSGIGTENTPYQVSATARLSMSDLTDVNDPEGAPNDGDVPVWVGSHWEFKPQTGGGGGGGALPNGGTTGQVLTKASSADGDANWTAKLPAGGAVGETLVKLSAADGDANWRPGLDEVIVKAAPAPSTIGYELWVDLSTTPPDPVVPSGSDQLIQSGINLITPSAANVPTKIIVTLPKPYALATDYVVVCSPYTAVPGSTVTGVATSGRTATTFELFVTRTNTTSTYVSWIAVGKAP